MGNILVDVEITSLNKNHIGYKFCMCIKCRKYEYATIVSWPLNKDAIINWKQLVAVNIETFLSKLYTIWYKLYCICKHY